MIEQKTVATIQPMCPIEEYARRARSCVWFIPPIPPVIVLKATVINTSKEQSLGIIRISKHIGAIFCRVARIIHIIHEILVITWGSQWWKGAIPNFIIILTINIILEMYATYMFKDEFIEMMPLVSIRPLPIAWMMKYFTLASVSWNNWEEAIKGINDNRFSSIPIHTYSQFVLDNATKVPVIVVVINRNEEGDIKKRKELNLSGLKLEAFSCSSVS